MQGSSCAPFNKEVFNWQQETKGLARIVKGKSLKRSRWTLPTLTLRSRRTRAKTARLAQVATRRNREAPGQRQPTVKTIVEKSCTPTQTDASRATRIIGPMIRTGTLNVPVRKRVVRIAVVETKVAIKEGGNTTDY